MCREAGVITWVQILWGPAPLKFGKAKNVKIRRDFGQILIRSRISPERMLPPPKKKKLHPNYHTYRTAHDVEKFPEVAPTYPKLLRLIS